MILAHLKTNLKSAGFTMIELLIVIGIIAVLATAVLAAINPVDQINKARDAGLVSSTSEMIKATERYYVTADAYPWNDAASPPTSPDSAYSNSNPNSWDAWITLMENVGEVKKGYSAKIRDLSNSGISGFIYKELNNPTVSICFYPRSKQFREDALDMCNTNASSLPSSPAAYDACPGAYPQTTWNNQRLCVQ